MQFKFRNSEPQGQGPGLFIELVQSVHGYGLERYISFSDDFKLSWNVFVSGFSASFASAMADGTATVPEGS